VAEQPARLGGQRPALVWSVGQAARQEESRWQTVHSHPDEGWQTEGLGRPSTFAGPDRDNPDRHHRALQLDGPSRDSAAPPPHLVEGALSRGAHLPCAVVEGILSSVPGARITAAAGAGFAAALPRPLPGDGRWAHRPAVVGG